MSDAKRIDKNGSKAVTDNDEVKPLEYDLMEPSKLEESNDDTNALGYAKDWYSSAQIVEPTEPKEEEPTGQITLEEIEVIRKEAYEDGFNEGKKEGSEAGFAEGKNEGVKAGYEEGFAQGREEGIANGNEIVAKEAARLSKFANHLVKPIADFDKEIGSEMVYLASRLTRAFIKQELSQSYEFLEKSISEMCRLLPVANAEVTISLNPKDVELLKTVINNPEIKIVPDPNLKTNDIRAESAMSSIDVRLEERIDNYLTEFLALNTDRALEAIKDNGFAEDPTFDNISLEESNNTPAQEASNMAEPQLAADLGDKAENNQAPSEVLQPVSPKQAGISLGPKK